MFLNGCLFESKVAESKSDFFFYRFAEQLMIRILKNKPDLTGELGYAHGSGADAVDQDLAFGWFEQTVEVLDERGFSSAVLPHDCNEFAVWNG